MIEVLNNFLLTEECRLIIKLVLIIILSGFIGLERQSWSKPAGFRTHVLVGISAVIVMECGLFLYNKSSVQIDPTRIAAQLLSGIGFLGAGTILRDGFTVKGLTTSATLLVVTCIGLIIGAGFYVGGIIATLFSYLILRYSKLISDRVEHSAELNLEIELTNPKDTIEKIGKILEEHNVDILSLKTLHSDEQVQNVKICGHFREKINRNKLLSDLIICDNIINVFDN